ncbi:MAG: 50S ribosomal protein L22 [Puniceicoccales bacterium]|jgi:large subunit ribosomal protein L22|nr:50S ribosomal protein L22 [Puniceicoccales bacterium]
MKKETPVKEPAYPKATLKYVRISAKKVRDLARLLKGKPVLDAVAFVKNIRRKSARMIGDLLHSAIANAENNNNLAANKLMIESVIVEDGPVLKRFIPAARGSAHPIRKRMSHIRLILRNIDKKVG